MSLTEWEATRALYDERRREREAARTREARAKAKAAAEVGLSMTCDNPECGAPLLEPALLCGLCDPAWDADAVLAEIDAEQERAA